jgi:uncharacterized protein (DUF1697 family)
MSVAVLMLRGVNVGSHHLIKMESLRGLCDSLRLQDAQTHIQSGNVVFKTDERDLARLAGRIEKAIEQNFGFRPDVIVRTISELRDAIRKNPFGKRAGVDPSKLLVVFLAGDPGPEALDKALRIKGCPEELRIPGREIFIYYPNGMAETKLVWTSILKKVNTTGTGRNWNTVRKLLEMAEKLEISA